MAKLPNSFLPFPAAPLPAAQLSPEEKLACLRLIRTDNVGAVSFRKLINRYGGATRALEAIAELNQYAGRKAAIASKDEAETELAAAERAGAEAVFTIEPGYPAALALIDCPPPMVYIKGRRALLDRPAIAIVGSRQCSAAGSKLSRVFARALGAAGYVIVSGLARGIDAAAHRASLETGTAAVIAGGIDTVYPPEHEELQREIGAAGCLVTDRPPGFKARGQDFPRRNRIIAGISLGVVIVEAAARSGTLVTARYAGEHGREVFAVPGNPLDPRAEGTNGLIKNGAMLVTDPEDVLSALEPIVGMRDGLRSGPAGLPWRPSDPPNAEPHDSSGQDPAPEVGEKEHRKILDALGPAPADLDAIIGATGLSARAIQIALLELDLAGLISRPGPGLFSLRNV